MEECQSGATLLALRTEEGAMSPEMWLAFKQVDSGAHSPLESPGRDTALPVR